MQPNKAYYAVIPAFVRYHPDISNGAKLLYGEITALCNERGYCWASNAYFAELYKVDARTIKRWIKELLDAKTIAVKVDQTGGNSRQIRVSSRVLPSDKNVPTSGQKRPDPSDKNVTHNNTVNKTVNNTHTEADSSVQDWGYPIQPLLDAFPSYLADRLTPGFVGFIVGEVKEGDEVAWERTIETYRMNFDPLLNRYLPDKVANVIGVFRKHKAEVEKEKQNGTNRKSNGFAPKPTAAQLIASRPYRSS